jgi:hypothetical protein
VSGLFRDASVLGIRDVDEPGAAGVTGGCGVPGAAIVLILVPRVSTYYDAPLPALLLSRLRWQAIPRIHRWMPDYGRSAGVEGCSTQKPRR